MPRYIERRNTASGPRYREWSSVVDVYCTAELTREEMAAYLFENSFESEGTSERIEERLARTDHQGISIHRSSRDMDSPWGIERCGRCGNFHHEFKVRPRMFESQGCRECGEPLNHRCHSKACE